jgi:hypothetical protein
VVERRASREIENGHVVTVRLGQSTHGVLGARTALGDDDAELLPVVQPAEAVGRHQRPTFLAEHHGSDALLGHGLDQVVGGKAADPLDAFRFQDAGDGLESVHVVS